MTPHDWFVLGIRLFGLWSLTQGVSYLANFVDLQIGLSDTPRATNPNSYLFYAACDFTLAAYFLLGTRHLAGICERGGSSEEPGPDDEEIG